MTKTISFAALVGALVVGYFTVFDPIGGEALMFEMGQFLKTLA